MTYRSSIAAYDLFRAGRDTADIAYLLNITEAEALIPCGRRLLSGRRQSQHRCGYGYSAAGSVPVDLIVSLQSIVDGYPSGVSRRAKKVRPADLVGALIGRASCRCGIGNTGGNISMRQ